MIISWVKIRQGMLDASGVLVFKIEDLATYTSVNEKTVRLYINQFISDEIIERLSDKIRDKNAIYILKKH